MQLSFTAIPIAVVRSVHDALCAWRLWEELDLTHHLGCAPPVSAPSRILAPLILPLFEDTLTGWRHKVVLEPPTPASWNALDRLVHAWGYARFALRVYAVPALAAHLLPDWPRDTLAERVVALDTLIPEAFVALAKRA
jgi:hypothetical protein